MIVGNAGVEASAVAIGKFDGLHRGHRALLAAAREEATRLGVPAGVVTFDRHPMEVLRPGHAPPYLTPLDAKLGLLEEAGMDFCLLLRLGEGVLTWTAHDFVQRVLVNGVGARCVVAGADFRYGRGREGTLDTLRSDGDKEGFRVRVVDTISVDGVRVSSFAVREALSAGDPGLAGTLLGRRYSVRGTVIEGRKLGRKLGFPTANLAFSERLALPANGIYAVIADWDGGPMPSVASLGTRPTVESLPAPVVLEVHVLDWSGDLYGRRLRVEFVQRLRAEKRFDGLEALAAQIARDADAARLVLRREALRPAG